MQNKILTLQQEVNEVIAANFEDLGLEPVVLEDAKKSKKFTVPDNVTAIRVAYVLIEETGREVSVFGNIIYIK